MLDQQTIDEFQRLLDRAADQRDEVSPLAALETPLEVIAYVVEVARIDGADEADAVELFLFDCDKHTLRGHATTLARLGYAAVADRLREMARERKRTARPAGHRLNKPACSSRIT